MIILGSIDLGGDRVAAEMVRRQPPGRGPDRGAVGQHRIEPVAKAVFLQGEWLPMVN